MHLRQTRVHDSGPMQGEACLPIHHRETANQPLPDAIITDPLRRRERASYNAYTYIQGGVIDRKIEYKAIQIKQQATLR